MTLCYRDMVRIELEDFSMFIAKTITKQSLFENLEIIAIQ